MGKTIFQISILAFLIAGCAGSRGKMSDNTARTYGRNAFAHFNAGNFDEALRMYQKALWYAGRSDHPLLKAHYSFNIGRVYFEKGIFDSARQYFYDSYGEFSFYKDTSQASFTAGFLALAYASSGEMDSAWEICRGKYGRNQSAFWNTICARVCLLENNFTDASGLLEKAALQYNIKKDAHALALNCYYRALVDFSNKSYSSAHLLLDSALTLLDRVPGRYDRWKVLVGLSGVEFCNGLEQNGYRLYKRAQECAPMGISIPALERVRSCDKIVY